MDHRSSGATQLEIPEAEAAAPRAKGRSRAKRTQAYRILAVGGGKGGIGKSLLSASLGIELAKRGRRVALVDADLGGANLHTCLGVDVPKVSLTDFVDRKVARIEDVAVPTGVPNLTLVSGALDALDAANLKYGQKMKLLRSVQGLDVDDVILDLGAGTSFNVLDFFLVADHGILVLVPEPTSIENAYRFIKAAFFRRLQTVQTVFGIESLVEQAVAQRQDGKVKTPFELLAAVRAQDAELGAALEQEMRRFRPWLVVNQARSEADRGVGDAVVAAWRKFFGLEMDYLGAVGYDDEVWKSVRKRRPVVVDQPQSETARSVSRIVDQLTRLDSPAPALTVKGN